MYVYDSNYGMTMDDDGFYAGKITNDNSVNI